MSEIENNADEFIKNLQLKLKLQQQGLNSWVMKNQERKIKY